MPQYKRGQRWWVRFAFDGYLIRKASPDNSKRGALEYELFLRQKLARGESLKETVPIVKYLFKDFALNWLEVFVKNNNKHSEFVSRGYTVRGDLIRYFGKKYIDEITSYDIEQYKIYLLNKQTLSPKSINNQLSILSKCLKTAIEWKLMEVLPKIKLLKVPPQKYTYLSIEESKSLLDTATGQWREMIILALNAGLRFGEIIGLKWENINFEENLLKVTQTVVRDIETSPKSNKIRTVPLNKDLLQMFLGKEKTGKYIFESNNGAPLQSCISIRTLHKICEEAGIKKIGWHALRHTFASRLAENNVSIVVVQQLLGHSDIKTTMRYVHTNIGLLHESVKTLEVKQNEQHNSSTISNSYAI